MLNLKDAISEWAKIVEQFMEGLTHDQINSLLDRMDVWERTIKNIAPRTAQEWDLMRDFLIEAGDLEPYPRANAES
jgi:hypothetical protein